MRTLAIIVGGLILLGFTVAAGRYVGGGGSRAIILAVKGFLAVWFLVALFNFWMGVSRAGYSVGEELPIFLLVYVVPGALAAIVWWRLASRA
jgi:hypothetical protein